MTSWPDHLPSGNQKRFWRDPERGAAVYDAKTAAVLARADFVNMRVCHQTVINL
jgi:hypothetical protein